MESKEKKMSKKKKKIVYSEKTPDKLEAVELGNKKGGKKKKQSANMIMISFQTSRSHYGSIALMRTRTLSTNPRTSDS